MDSHQYADRMIALAEWLKSRPVFETGWSEFTERFYFWSNKDNFLAAVKAVGAGTKEFKEDEIIFQPVTPEGTALRIKATRSTVCRKVQEEKWECDPLLSPDEEKQLQQV